MFSTTLEPLARRKSPEVTPPARAFIASCAVACPVPPCATGSGEARCVDTTVGAPVVPPISPTGGTIPDWPAVFTQVPGVPATVHTQNVPDWSTMKSPARNPPEMGAPDVVAPAYLEAAVAPGSPWVASVPVVWTLASRIAYSATKRHLRLNRRLRRPSRSG